MLFTACYFIQVDALLSTIVPAGHFVVSITSYEARYETSVLAQGTKQVCGIIIIPVNFAENTG